MPDAKCDAFLACWDYNVLGERCLFYSGGECNMPDAKYDAFLACWDYNVLGERCPFYSGGECNILGWGKGTPVPDDLICDKVPGPITDRTIILFDLDEDYARELKELHASDEYKRWEEAWYHYKKDAGTRRKLEQEALYAASGQMSRREFKKRFKPNDLGVRPDEAPTFRMRVLDHLRAAPQPFSRSGSGKETEKVAFWVHHMNDRYLDDEEVTEECLSLEFLTRNSHLENEVIEVGMDDLTDTGLGQIMGDHIGKKVLVEVKWWWNVYDGPNGYDGDSAISEVKLLKVLE